MQTRGSLAETNVRSLLESAQAERATGTLTLRQNGSSATTLYFLFGHLFHAVGDGAAGDDAVVSALAWAEGDFDFDAKAKLPADETVRSSIPELIDRAGANGSGRSAATNSTPAPKPPSQGRASRSQPAQPSAPPPPQEAAAWAPPPGLQVPSAPASVTASAAA